ncbi:MAG TPA: hypothetical protein VGN16_17040 [Acidobacteriaceae bacterium]|jgi:hypothetical protein
MAELSLAPPPDRSPLVSILIAASVLAAIAAAIFLFIPRQTSKLTVTGVQTFAPHTEFAAAKSKSGTMNIVGQDPAAEDDLYVVVSVRLEDRYHLPFTVDDINGSLTLADGSQPAGSVVNRGDLARLATIFPQLASTTPHPLGFDDEVQPGKPLDGQVVLQFPNTNAQAWQTKKSASVSLALRNQGTATANIP